MFKCDDGEEIKITGEMTTPVFGWRYKLCGEFKRHERHGLSFRFVAFEPELPRSWEGLCDYLSRYVPALGDQRARLIADHFGNDTYNILRQAPGRISEVDGIGKKTAAAVQAFFESEEAENVDMAAYGELYDLLSSIRPPRKVVLSLLERFGSNAPQFVRHHPYKLLAYPGMGWNRVDTLAVETLKCPKDGPDRQEAAILEVMEQQAANEGHTIVAIDELLVDAMMLMKCRATQETYDRLVDAGLLVPCEDGIHVALWWLHEAEAGIARHIRRLQATFRPSVRIGDVVGLDSGQAALVPILENNAVCILDGIPGSGKSHTMAVAIRAMCAAGMDDEIRVVAPTGKAAKRDAEFLAQAVPGSNIPSTTIHRALGCRPSSSGEIDIPADDAKINRGRDKYEFVHGPDNPMGESLFFCDESSMADVVLFCCLVSAIPDGGRLVIVGDHNQLPSVGPGAVLRDLKDTVPTVSLDRPHRNSGAIARLCCMIKDGIPPDLDRLSAAARRDGFADNVTHRATASDEATLKMITDIHMNYINKYGVDMMKENLQVVSAQKERPFVGCKDVNNAIRAIATPPGDEFSIGMDADERVGVRVGDKVISTKNRYVDILLNSDMSEADLVSVFGEEEANRMEYEEWREVAREQRFGGRHYLTWKCYVVNGDMGEAVGFIGHGGGKHLVVRFRDPERLCVLGPAEAHILLAYCITVHKMQGSQYPIVIMPLSEFHWNPRTKSGLWARELPYTGASRPQERLILVGPARHLHDAVGRQTIHRRQTQLRSLMGSITSWEPSPPTYTLDFSGRHSGIDPTKILASSAFEEKDNHIPFVYDDDIPF